MVFLPEAFDFVGTSKEESAQLSEKLDGQLITAYCDMAKEWNLWLSLGGFHERQVSFTTNNQLCMWFTQPRSCHVKSMYDFLE